MLKDISQHFVGGDFSTCDGCECVKNVVDVATDEVAGKIGVEAFFHTADASEGVAKSGIVACTRHNDVVVFACDGFCESCQR